MWCLREYFDYLKTNGKWWITPTILLLVILNAMLDQPLPRVNAVKNVLNGMANGAAAIGFALQGGASFVEGCGIDVPQHHRGAGSEHPLGDGKADTARAAGDDRGTVFQIDGVHARPRFGESS